MELGRHFSREIAHTVATYRTLFETRATGPFDVDLWSDRAWTAIQRLAPVHADEIAGIAEGAGLDPRQVASVYARTEILVAANPTGQTECSTVVSLPPGKPPVAVQTWDWYDAMSDGWFAWTIPMPDGRIVQTVTEFGMLAKIGVNDRGVGVMLNMLHHADDATEVVAIASAPRTSASTALTVLDDQGDAASVELFPGGPGVVEPTDGVLVRTNHFVSDAGRDGCLASTIGVSTEIRREHLVEAFATHRPQSGQEVLASMTHHADGAGVCRHPLAGTAEPLWTRTLATVSLDVAHRGLGVAENGPCGHRLEPAEQPA